MLSSLVAGHPIAVRNPRLARKLDFALSNHVASSTKRSYASGANSYMSFCTMEGVAPFPVDALWLCAWLIYAAMYVTVPSLLTYLAAVRYEHGSRGFPWVLSGNEQVRRVILYVKKKYGCKQVSKKLPISLSMVMKMALLLPGWPSPVSMSHDDRLFVCMSVLAVLGFLRGGEFLASAGSSRDPLLAREVRVVCKENVKFVSVSISRPKARWWIPYETAQCFSDPSSPALDPAHLLESYRSFSDVPLPPFGPAFRRASGDIASKTWFVKRTTQLLAQSHLLFSQVSWLGVQQKVLAASWRAGGVRTAKDAGVSDSVIMVLGRWASSAWLRYFSSSSSDVRHAVRAMWQSSSSVNHRVLDQVGVAFPHQRAVSGIVHEVRLAVANRQAADHPAARAVYVGSPNRRSVG
jgi:hypothetical protein